MVLCASRHRKLVGSKCMRVLVFLVAVGAVFAGYENQNSGYETAEQQQPAPQYPMTSDGGDQQGYNSDGRANDAPPPQYKGGNGGGVPGVSTPDIKIKVPGVDTPDLPGPVEVKPEPPVEVKPQPPVEVKPNPPVYPKPSYPAPGPAPYKDSGSQYPSNQNYEQGEKAYPAPNVNAQGGDGLAYSNEVRLRARRF
ncbi:hypothetical protein Aduo_014136 [Ancylostoma duodenale]